MKRLVMRPGLVVATNPIAMPADAPRLHLAVSAEIWRNANALTPDNHDSAVLGPSVDLDDHAEALMSGALAAHAAHPHDITTVVTGIGGGALTDPVIPGPLESAGGGQVNVGAVDVLAAPQAHVAAGGAAIAHAYGVGVPTVHTGVTAQVLVPANPTRIDRDTFSLDVNTQVDDLLELTYVEEGAVLVP